MSKNITVDFSDFGWRERKMAAKLLTASCAQGLPDEFEEDGIKIMFNTSSGRVFFTNADGDMCAMNCDKLEMWWTTPYYGHEGFAEELKDTMVAVRLSFTWFGNYRKVREDQKEKAVQPFGAKKEFVTMGKKLLNTEHETWKKLTEIRGKIESLWEHNSLQYTIPGTRLMKRSDLIPFREQFQELRRELKIAEQAFEAHYAQLQEDATDDLKEFFNAGDYPPTMIGQFNVIMDLPEVKVPNYLLSFDPALYREQEELVNKRFEDVVLMAEEAFNKELMSLIEHLAERLAGTHDGKPKIFRESILGNFDEFFQRFKNLDVGSSPELARLVTETRNIVSNTSTDELRQSESMRAAISRNLQPIQASLEGLMKNRPRRNLIRPGSVSNQA